MIRRERHRRRTTRSVRTTMSPHSPVEVTEAEYRDLDRQGLLLPDSPTAVTPPPAGATSPIHAIDDDPPSTPVPASRPRITTGRKAATKEE
ncbi:hypothetical protein ACFVWN_01070 [Nocardiopsis flavescens]|uniref:hypothetical protein n=1 Tax=Nocardiopsis flavescens TaxID=758803 RepID=UPI00364BE29B